MFNRIDRIVTFLPLEEDVLRRIARRELRLLDQREGILTAALETRFADSLVDEIVRRGYDPRYGARPIKRAVERHLLAPLAARLNEYSAEATLTAEVECDGREIHISVRSRRGDESDGRWGFIRAPESSPSLPNNASASGGPWPKRLEAAR